MDNAEPSVQCLLSLVGVEVDDSLHDKQVFPQRLRLKHRMHDQCRMKFRNNLAICDEYNNNHREFIEDFQRLKALCNLITEEH